MQAPTLRIVHFGQEIVIDIMPHCSSAHVLLYGICGYAWEGVGYVFVKLFKWGVWFHSTHMTASTLFPYIEVVHSSKAFRSRLRVRKAFQTVTCDPAGTSAGKWTFYGKHLLNL